MSRIVVAMSGGVDSSVAAALLVEAGHEVHGVTLRTFCYTSGPAHARSCCGLEGVQDARDVARALGISHTVLDVEEAFARDVIEDFVSEYLRGRTPNPCVRCNSFTKFRDLLAHARDLGAEAIATGHYVRCQRDPATGQWALLRGVDTAKDQAYFLWGIPADSLPHLRFPLGGLRKEEVRTLARKRGLVTAEKAESQEICFVPGGDYRHLLRERAPAQHPAFQPGAFVTRDGTRVGTHPGYAAFTVGQRRGLPGGFSEPMYVLEIRPATREVVIGRQEELTSPSVVLEEMNWLAPPPGRGSEVQLQLRHRAAAVPARIRHTGDTVELELTRTPAVVTPGQSGVIFSGDRVLGGGRIAPRAERGRRRSELLG